MKVNYSIKLKRGNYFHSLLLGIACSILGFLLLPLAIFIAGLMIVGMPILGLFGVLTLKKEIEE